MEKKTHMLSVETYDTGYETQQTVYLPACGAKFKRGDYAFTREGDEEPTCEACRAKLGLEPYWSKKLRLLDERKGRR